MVLLFFELIFLIQFLKLLHRLNNTRHEEMLFRMLCQAPTTTFSLHLKMTAVFHFPQKKSDGHGSNGADECQNKQTVEDKTKKKMNVSEK